MDHTCIHDSRDRWPQRTCVAHSPDVAGICGAPLPSGSVDICDACRDRIHALMMNTLHRYGDVDLARDLDAHYRAHHRPGRWGTVCPDCFRAAHARTLRGGGRPRYTFTTWR